MSGDVVSSRSYSEHLILSALPIEYRLDRLEQSSNCVAANDGAFQITILHGINKQTGRGRLKPISGN